MLNSLGMKRWWEPRELSMKVGHRTPRRSYILCSGWLHRPCMEPISAPFTIRLFLFLFQSLPYRPGWPIEGGVWCKFYQGYEEGKSWTAINVPSVAGTLGDQELGKGWVCLGRIHATGRGAGHDTPAYSRRLDPPRSPSLTWCSGSGCMGQGVLLQWCFERRTSCWVVFYYHAPMFQFCPFNTWPSAMKHTRLGLARLCYSPALWFSH